MSREVGLDPALVVTDAARQLLERPVFPAIGPRNYQRPLGGHVAVNGHDLHAVEVDARRAALADVREQVEALPWLPVLTVNEYRNAILALLGGDDAD